MFRSLFLTFSLLASAPALAGTIAVVDFQRAVEETEEGKAAKTQIEGLYNSRKSEIDRMQKELEKELQDYQSRAMILSESARQQEEQALMGKQQQFEQTYMQYQGELQQAQLQLLQDLSEKMRALSGTIAKEKGFDLVLDQAAVVYTGGDVVDMTDVLVSRYNTTHKK